jgi:hypothetical protein
MKDALALEVLRQEGRQHAAEAAAALVGLDREEGLLRLTSSREALEQRKAAMYAAGSSPAEVQAWASGYTTELTDQLGAWLPSVKDDGEPS